MALIFGSDTSSNRPISNQLSPIHPPLGINLNFAVPQPTTLIIKEKAWSFSGSHFQVRDQNGIDVLKCKDKSKASLTSSTGKIFTDNAGNILFKLKENINKVNKTFYGEAPDGRKLFEMKEKVSIQAFLGKSKFVVEFINFSNRAHIELLMKPDEETTIKMGGIIVAEIKKKHLTARNLLLGEKTYQVDVPPGVDLSLIAAICIGLHQKATEDKILEAVLEG
ncbi:uncharacterized protein PAC_07555 [Phialocephala subalpina]|uniref:Tubby C-terminal domain-containing protein n=1 Tax=Phialocephala subalpina TaxID=576137 RepID=A0A1L7WY15_9HELO|nr:uncharacterized protein PAC_07555 [Phialocephala subalpina]